MSRRIRFCTKCENYYEDYPAISRVDNKTEICPVCGMKEALEVYARYTPVEDTREEAKKNLPLVMQEMLDKTGKWPEKKDIQNWLESEYGLGEEVDEFLQNIIFGNRS